MATKVIDSAALASLAETVTGDVLSPDDPSYNEHRALYNAMFDKRPAVIVRCNTPDDVIAAVRFGRRRDCTIRAVPRYMIVRTFEVGSDQMPRVGRRSRELTEDQFPEITWEHSHVVVDDDGTVRTYCIYEAPSEETVRNHARMLGEHTIEGLHEIAGDVTPADFPASATAS